VQGPQHDDPSRNARQLPAGVIPLSREGDLSPAPSHGRVARAGDVAAATLISHHTVAKPRCQPPIRTFCWLTDQSTVWTSKTLNVFDCRSLCCPIVPLDGPSGTATR